MDQLAAAPPESGFAEMSLPDAFARVAAAHGGRLAVASAAWQATYAELDTVANRLAHAMQGDGVAPGDRVAILMQHDTPLIAAMLAVLKAGAVVVVLNPGHPDARLRQATDDAAATLLLVDAASRARAGAVGACASLCFDDRWQTGPSHDPGLRIAPEALAVLTYTSGSSGQPKAVMQAHRRILHNAFRLSSGMGVAAGERIALLASLSGGQGMGTAWCALANGASLWPFATMEKGVVALADWMIEHAIGVYVSSASLFRNFMSTLDGGVRFPQVRVVRLASEFATWDDVAAFRRHFPPGCSLIHTLSSSETGNMAQFSVPRDAPLGTGRLPVGRPARGMEILLVDDEGRPVRPGEAGEIVARSRYLASGYWRNPVLTAGRFAEDPSGLRSYRSGDRARVNADGLLEFAGRGDTRIKIRGFRIEPSDVEAALLALPDVAQAVVRGYERPGGETILAAWLAPRGDRTLTAAALRRELRVTLPDHMVPTAFVFLASLPLTPHGKVDHDALRWLHPPTRAAASEEQPRTATEARLAAIWGEVMRVAEVGRRDDFFEQGGDSLKAAVIAARVHATLDAALSLATFIEHPTLAALAAAIDAQLRDPSAEDVAPVAAAPRDAPLPLSFFQERAWRGSQTPEGLAAYSGSRQYRIVGPLDVAALRACLDAIMRRHEILRTTYAIVDGGPVQVVHPSAPAALAFGDVAACADAEDAASRFLADEAATPLDLARLPLIRFALVRVRENEHWLMRMRHHILSDSWSSRLFFRELALLYEARQRGEPDPLPERAPLQYADFAVWQRETMHPAAPAYARRLAWWKDILADGAPALDPPFRRAAPVAGLSPEHGRVTWGIDSEAAQRLNALARSGGATAFAARLAALVALLSAEAGTPDVVIGAYARNRSRVEIQEMLGLFVNLVILRFRCEPAMTFRELAAAVRTRIAEVEARSDVPFEDLCQQLRDQGVTPPALRVIVSLSGFGTPLRFGGLVVTPMRRVPRGMPWGFQVIFSEYDEAQDCVVWFDAGIYDPAAVSGFTGRLQALLDAASRRPDATIGELLPAAAAPRAGGWRKWLGFLPSFRRAT